MPSSFLDEIDWEAPWLLPYQETGRAVSSSDDWRRSLNRLARDRQLVNFTGRAIQFVPQESLPAGEPYEAYIGRTGAVPTRENLHDFFNALVWLTFPRTKARLNELQVHQLRLDSQIQPGTGAYKVGNRRGPLRDAATIFDENAALLIAQDGELVRLLSARQWSTVFLQRRSEFRQSYDVVLFGHALMEKLVRPYASITAHCFALVGTALWPPPCIPELDRLTACQCSPSMSTASFLPVPVLGFPGWHPDQDATFYSNKAVFRVVKRERD